MEPSAECFFFFLIAGTKEFSQQLQIGELQTVVNLLQTTSDRLCRRSIEHSGVVCLFILCARILLLFRVAVGEAPSLCGHLVTVAGRKTAATVTATPTASTHFQSAAAHSTAMCHGTARPAPPPSPPPTAVEDSMRNRL